MTVNATCPYCGRFFKTRYWFDYHVWSTHPTHVEASRPSEGDGKTTCRQCGKPYLQCEDAYQ